MQSLKSDLSFFPNVAIAEANRENIGKQYQKIRTEAEKENYLNRLNELVSHIEEAKHVSINMSTQSLLKFLRTGEYLNAHELIERGMRKPETIFYYQSRCSIEEALGYTEEIRRNIYYGTLNTGNLGAINFGLCCVVFKPKSEIKLRVSFLKQNSLSYRKAEYPFLKRDMAIWENVHQLSAIKHQDSIKERKLPFSQDDINFLILFYSATLRLSDFIEAHIWGKITPDLVSEVRLPEDDFDFLMRCLADSRKVFRLAPSEKRRVRSLADVIKNLKQFNIPITLM